MSFLYNLQMRSIKPEVHLDVHFHRNRFVVDRFGGTNDISYCAAPVVPVPARLLLILRRCLHVINNQDLHGRFTGLQLQPKLFAESPCKPKVRQILSRPVLSGPGWPGQRSAFRFQLDLVSIAK